MGHWVVEAYIDPQHLHILTSNPSLKGPLDTILLGGQWIGNWPLDTILNRVQNSTFRVLINHVIQFTTIT